MWVPRLLADLLQQEHFTDRPAKMAFVVGPRQCGKTTLARFLQKERGTPELYRNWDDLAWRSDLSRNPYGFLDAFRPLGAKPLAVLDEIHKFPRWKNYLKGLWDTRGQQFDLLVTGSGRLDIYRKGGDSLLGRYHQYRLHPFSLSEVLRKKFSASQDTPERILQNLWEQPRAPRPQEEEALQNLLRFGGFPEPFLHQEERSHRLWLREKREILIRQELRDWTRIQMLSSVEQMVELLALRVGSLFSLNNLREQLQVSMDAARLWLEQLERIYYCYRIRPYAGKISRALRREPKLYLYDWSELQEPSQRLENLVASSLMRWCHFTQDWGQKELRLHFIRDKEKREVDFLLTRENKPLLLLEVKLSDPAPTENLHYFSQKLGGVPKLLLVGELKQPGLSQGTRVLPAASFLSSIP